MMTSTRIALAVAPLWLATSGSAAAQTHPDVLLDYFDSGNGSITCPEAQGGSWPPNASSPRCVAFDAALGKDPVWPATLASPADYVSIPLGSHIILGFSDRKIVDGPGHDLVIYEVGVATEDAEVYVSSALSTAPADFVFLGMASFATGTSFDLAGVMAEVRAVKIVSLGNGGAPAAPGFDLAYVEGKYSAAAASLPRSVPVPFWALGLMFPATWLIAAVHLPRG